MGILDHVSVVWNRDKQTFMFYAPPHGLGDGFCDEEMALAALCERLEKDPDWVKSLTIDGEIVMERTLGKTNG